MIEEGGDGGVVKDIEGGEVGAENVMDGGDDATENEGASDVEEFSLCRKYPPE